MTFSENTKSTGKATDQSGHQIEGQIAEVGVQDEWSGSFNVKQRSRAVSVSSAVLKDRKRKNKRGKNDCATELQHNGTEQHNNNGTF
jgi:hypothetical protein